MELRHRCRQVVAGTPAEFEKFIRHDRADGMQALVMRTGMAASVAEEPGQRIVRTALQRAAKDVLLPFRATL